MENLTDYYTDINKLEEEVERLEEELESYDVQKLMVDDVKFCENKINNIPKEINRIIDTEIKKLKIRLSKNYESENGSNTSCTKDKRWTCKDCDDDILSQYNSQPWNYKSSEPNIFNRDNGDSLVILPSMSYGDTSEKVRYGSYEDIMSGKIVIPIAKNETSTALEIIPIRNVVDDKTHTITFESIEKRKHSDIYDTKFKILKEKNHWSDTEIMLVNVIINKLNTSHPKVSEFVKNHVLDHKKDLSKQFKGTPFTAEDLKKKHTGKPNWPINDLNIVMNIQKKYADATHLLYIFHNYM